MIITTTKKTLIFNYLFCKNCLQFLSFVLVVSLVFLIGFQNLANAQSPKMSVFAIVPEWNGKQFCDQGLGYDPVPINAPSVSYSGKNVQEPSYDYSWQQKKNEEEWVTVASGKGVGFIPSYNPPAMFNKTAGSAVITYSWKLLVKDMANGKQTSESDVYSLSVASALNASYIVTPSKNIKNKFSVDLTVKGGYAKKTFAWSAVDQHSVVPQTQLKIEDQDGLVPGFYQVMIGDGVCNSISHKVNVVNVMKSKEEKSQ